MISLIARGNDGVVTGVCCHLFMYRPETRELKWYRGKASGTLDLDLYASISIYSPVGDLIWCKAWEEVREKSDG